MCMKGAEVPWEEKTGAGKATSSHSLKKTNVENNSPLFADCRGVLFLPLFCKFVFFSSLFYLHLSFPLRSWTTTNVATQVSGAP